MRVEFSVIDFTYRLVSLSTETVPRSLIRRADPQPTMASSASQSAVVYRYRESR